MREGIKISDIINISGIFVSSAFAVSPLTLLKFYRCSGQHYSYHLQGGKADFDRNVEKFLLWYLS